MSQGYRLVRHVFVLGYRYRAFLIRLRIALAIAPGHATDMYDSRFAGYLVIMPVIAIVPGEGRMDQGLGSPLLVQSPLWWYEPCVVVSVIVGHYFSIPQRSTSSFVLQYVLSCNDGSL